MADVLTRTARQVRLDQGPVHQMIADSFGPNLGRQYVTACGRILTGAEGAILTTREASCDSCLSGGSVGLRGQRALLDQLPAGAGS